jgi:hypothetical protein
MNHKRIYQYVDDQARDDINSRRLATRRDSGHLSGRQGGVDVIICAGGWRFTTE